MDAISIKEINRLALPAILAGIAEPVISLADTAIIGHLGASELGGVGVATSFYMLVVWILAQTKSAVSAIVARYYGSKELNKISGLIPQAIALNLILGGVFTFATLQLLPQIFSLYSAEGKVLEVAKEYYSIRAFGFALILATFGIFGIFRGLQNTKWAMQISVIGGLVNVLLDLILVFGIEGVIPSYGVAGAAWASVMASGLMFVLANIYLLKKTEFRFTLPSSIDPELLKLIRMSTHLFIRTAALNVAYFLGTKFATSYSDQHIAAHTIAMNIWLFSAFFIDGYSSAGNAISGRLLGAKDYDNLHKLGWKVTRIGLLIATGLSIVYLLSYPIMGKLFTGDKQVLTL